MSVPKKKARFGGAGGLTGCAGRPRRPEAGRRGMTEAGARRRRRLSSTGGAGVGPEAAGAPGGNGGRGEVPGTSTVLGTSTAKQADVRSGIAHRRLAGEERSAAATTSHDVDQNLLLMGWEARWEGN